VPLMNVFDKMDRQHLMDERDEGRDANRLLRDAPRRIAQGARVLTFEEQLHASLVAASDQETDPARVIARCGLRINDGNADEDHEDDHLVVPCPTVALELSGRVVQIDVGIAPLVEALNGVPGLTTIWSCEVTLAASTREPTWRWSIGESGSTSMSSRVGWRT
jgi:hypothetical protein